MGLVRAIWTSQARTLEEWPNICLAIAIILAWWLLMLDSFQWSEELGVFSAMVNKMLTGDVLSKFLPLYLPILLGFTTSMHAIYPQKTTYDSRWSSWWQTFESLLLFSLVGEPPDITPGDIHPLDMGWDRHFRDEFTEGVSRSNFSAGAFFMLYVSFCFIVLLLLINLLIAMMSSTYENEKDNARLQWRVLFARLVLRYELLNLPLAMCHPDHHERRVMLGKDGAASGFPYTHSFFRSYDKDAPLNLEGKGGDIFADVEDDEGDNSPPLPRVGPAEMSQKNVETVAKRLEAKLESIEAKLEDLVLKPLGGLAAPAAGIAVQVKQPQVHAASDLGGVPRYKAASDMEVARLRLPPLPRDPNLVSLLLTTSRFTPTLLHPSPLHCTPQFTHFPLCLQSLIASAQRTVAEVQRSANCALTMPARLPPVRFPPPPSTDGSQRPLTVHGQLFSQRDYDA